MLRGDWRVMCAAGGLILAGCGKAPPDHSPASGASSGPSVTATSTAPNPSAVPTASATSRSAAVDDPTPDPITHPCVVTAAQFDIELAKEDSSCKSDADCDCFPGGMTRKAGCGGVRSKASAKKLHELNAKLHEMKCAQEQNCAAWACSPKCSSGVCGR